MGLRFSSLNLTVVLPVRYLLMARGNPRYAPKGVEVLSPIVNPLFLRKLSGSPHPLGWPDYCWLRVDTLAHTEQENSQEASWKKHSAVEVDCLLLAVQ